MDIEALSPLFQIETTVEGWQQKEPFLLEKSPARLAGWKRYADSNGLSPAEHLLPRIYCYCPTDLPAFMSNSVGSPTESLRQQVKTLEPWTFWYQLAPGLVTKPKGILGRNRIICRSHLITSTVAKLLGKKIAQATVLDMGCNSGFFSMDIASRGVKQVMGVEMREENIRQGLFLQNYYGIKNIHFEQADVQEWKPKNTYTAILNLGLLYHVIDPVTLVRNTYDWCTDFAVIDTICHQEPISAYIAAFNKEPHRAGEGRYTAELQPTYRALIDTMHDAGFTDLIELIADPGVDGRVSLFYRNRMRRCIIGFKKPIAEVMAANAIE